MSQIAYLSMKGKKSTARLNTSWIWKEALMLRRHFEAVRICR